MSVKVEKKVIVRMDPPADADGAGRAVVTSARSLVLEHGPNGTIDLTIDGVGEDPSRSIRVGHDDLREALDALGVQ